MDIREGLDTITIEPAGGGVNVYGYGEYPESSVNHGMTRRVFLDAFDTREAAQAAYPRAERCEGRRVVETDPGPIAPAWFDPADAGERWDED